MSANKIVLTSGTNVGQNGAEHDDEFLFNCFVDHPAYSEITNVNTPTTFLLGSTGSGKTALLRMIKNQEENVSEFTVGDMAMNHIANSDTILFLKSLEVDLSLFFQQLWKHVFCISKPLSKTNFQTSKMVLLLAPLWAPFSSTIALRNHF